MTRTAEPKVAAFTAGPWEVLGPSRSPKWDEVGDCAIVGGPNRSIIAETFHQVATDETAPADANARLIASAPDLYSALKAAKAHIAELREAWERGCISEHDGLGGTRSNRNVDVDVLLRIVLAKADGWDE